MKLVQNLCNSSFLVEVCDRIYSQYNKRLFPFINHFRGSEFLRRKLEKKVSTSVDNKKSSSFNDFDWDTLFILDGCRYDLYKQVRGVEDYRITSGSTSKEAIKENFSEGEWNDTVLITGNAFFCDSQFEDATGREIDEVFHHVFKLFKGDESWSDEHGTVLAEDVARKASAAETLFPDKKKIVWFMQPHYPFIQHEYNERQLNYLQNVEGADVWELLENNILGKDEAWRGYKSNLEYVLSFVDSLVEELEGKVVVTSDHGNYLGEYGLYGHPYGRKDEAVRKVPLEVVS